MVSTERWASSSISSSQYLSEVDGVELYRGRDGALAYERGEDENSSLGDDVREVARRVLKDLDGLCLEPEDVESDSDDDEFDSGSEWGSDASSFRERRAGGMTLEELTVAVNASIAYHRPAKSVAVKTAKRSQEKEGNSRSRDRDGHHSRAYTRHQLKETSQGAEETLEVFQEMLERKERQFYTRTPSSAAVEDCIKHLQTTDPLIAPTATTNEHQEHTTMRDKATDTLEFLPLSALAPPITALYIPSPPPSLPLRVNDGYSTPWEESMEAAVAGPTVADLAKCRRKNEVHDLSSLSLSASGFSVYASSSSSSSSAVLVDPPLRSSITSNRSKVSNTSTRRSRTSSKSSSSSRSPNSCKIRSESCSTRGHKALTYSNTSSKCSHYEEKCQASHAVLVSPVEQGKTIDWQVAPASRTPEISYIQPETSSPSQEVPSSPALVQWELDLSNFAP